jgi:type IV pilus assembly protein PilV
MNSTGTTAAPAFASPASPSSSRPYPRRSATGFSLVEVLVTALLIGIGLLGMATLQGHAIAYTAQASQRATAAMLAADLLELIRATPADWALYLHSDASASTDGAICAVTPTPPAAQLACWRAEVARLLPASTALPAGTTYVCRSPSTGVCAPQSQTIEIQVAWKGNHGECLNTDSYCHVRLRSEI